MVSNFLRNLRPVERAVAVQATEPIHPAAAAAAEIDPIKQTAEKHRRVIDRHRQEIIAIEHACGVRVADLTAEIEEAGRAYERTKQQLEHAIDRVVGEADQRVETRRQLIRSSEAALIALEPNLATREAPMEGRMVPRPRQIQ